MNQYYERLIYNAIEKGVSDIHIHASHHSKILFRTSGKLVVWEKLKLDYAKRIVNYIRYISKIDMNYRNKPQTGHLVYNLKGKKYNLRVSSLVGKDDDTIVIRILNNHQSLSIDMLTSIKKVQNFLFDIVSEDHGLFVISGATGSGKSTTLYTLLDTIYQQKQRNIITLEDPIEIDKNYCLQIQLNENQGITYDESLKQILRHDPDVIMIGEIRDEITAHLALTCALTGHLVLTTIHASNCRSTIKRLENLGINRIDLQDVLVGIMTQKMTFNEKGQHIILPEFMNKQQIDSFLQKHNTSYFDFEQATQSLNDLGVYNE